MTVTTKNTDLIPALQCVSSSVLAGKNFYPGGKLVK